MRRNEWVVCCAVAAALGTACQEPELQPILKLQGQLVSGTTLTPPGAITLAIAWYPAWYGGSPGAAPSAVVTQPVTYDGTFPLDFTFQVTGRPPAEAMVDLSAKGGTGQGAYGTLIAFRDLNGNGTLDVATATEPSPDRIVGASTADPSLPPPLHTWFVAYLDGTPASTDLLAAYRLEPGYNLVQIHSAYGSEAVPANTPIALPITNTDAMGYYACAEASFNYMNTVACGIDPYGGRYRLDGVLSGARPSQLRILDGYGARADGTLTYNGEAIPYDAPSESYMVHSVPGLNTMQVEVPGFPVETISATIPGPIHLLAPVPATRRSGQSIDLYWDPDPAVELYDVLIRNDTYDEETGYGWLYHELTTGTHVSTGPLRHTGTVYVDVIALAPLAVGDHGSYLTPINRIGATVEFTP